MSYFPSISGCPVLVTGHTGFKGSWLVQWLTYLGADVTGVALPEIPSTPSHFEAIGLSNQINDHRFDICDLPSLKGLISNCQPELVFHFAAQSVVGQGYTDPLKTFQTNVLGTLSILEAIRGLEKACIVVLITSDKCYENREWVWGYRETDRLGGDDPYSASKAAAEFAIRSYVRSFFPNNGLIRVGIGRAGNVIGGGDWAAGRIVPDCMRAWAENCAVEIRSPDSTRPWQHVLEPLGGYLRLAKKLQEASELHGEAFNFGPANHFNHTTRYLVDSMTALWPGASWLDISSENRKLRESGLLRLNCDKSEALLNWNGILSFDEVVKQTVNWYQCFYSNPNLIQGETKQQIMDYHARLENRKSASDGFAS